jgi:hypothetical protein
MRKCKLLKTAGAITAFALALSILSSGGFAAPKEQKHDNKSKKAQELSGSYTPQQISSSCSAGGGPFFYHDDSLGYGCYRVTNNCSKGRCTQHNVSCTNSGRCFFGDSLVTKGAKPDLDYPFGKPPGVGASPATNTGVAPANTGSVLPQTGTASTGSNPTPGPKPSGPVSTWTPGVKTASPVKLPEVYSPKPLNQRELR